MASSRKRPLPPRPARPSDRSRNLPVAPRDGKAEGKGAHPGRPDARKPERGTRATPHAEPKRAEPKRAEPKRAEPKRVLPAGTLQLAKALERVVHEGHPWVFRDALEGEVAPGSIATLLDRRGSFLARGVAEAGPIGFRTWTTDRHESVDAALVRRRAEVAGALRDRVVDAETSAYRLVHGEGDRMPGVVVDLYGAQRHEAERGAEHRYAVLRFDGAIESLGFVREALDPWLRERGVDTLLVKHGRKGETRVDVAWGSAPPPIVSVRERGMTLLADLKQGQKTGLFLDHRDSRFRVRNLARGLRVLNLYAYTGGFSIAAGLGGASHVTTVDVAPAAVALADEGWRANRLDPSVHRAVAADVPTFLAEDDARFDLVIADPPSFAPSERAKPAALEAYAMLHASCLERLPVGGLYLAASCSSHVRGADFEQTLRDGARKARKTLQILDRWGGAPDHPRLIAFPEGDYLDCVLTRVVG